MTQRKQLTIFQENNVPITLIDEDDTILSEYANSLSNFMSLNNISILETSHSAVIARPSKITLILVDNIDVSENEEDKEEDKPKIRIPGKKIVVTKKKPKVDIITDVN